MYRMQSQIKLKQGKITILWSYKQPIKFKMEESGNIEHTSINNFADIQNLQVEIWDFELNGLFV